MAYQEGSGSAGFSAFPAGAKTSAGALLNNVALPSAPISAITNNVISYAWGSTTTNQTPEVRGYSAARTSVFGGECYMPRSTGAAGGFPDGSYASAGTALVPIAAANAVLAIPLAADATNTKGAFPTSALLPVWLATEPFVNGASLPTSNAPPVGYVLSLGPSNGASVVFNQLINATGAAAAIVGLNFIYNSVALQVPDSGVGAIIGAGSFALAPAAAAAGARVVCSTRNLNAGLAAPIPGISFVYAIEATAAGLLSYRISAPAGPAMPY